MGSGSAVVVFAVEIFPSASDSTAKLKIEVLKWHKYFFCQWSILLFFIPNKKPAAMENFGQNRMEKSKSHLFRPPYIQYSLPGCYKKCQKSVTVRESLVVFLGVFFEHSQKVTVQV